MQAWSVYPQVWSLYLQVRSQIMRNHFIIPIFFFHVIFILHHKFLYACTICILTGMISILVGKIRKMKSQFTISYISYFCAIFNLHHEFLYVGTICILTGMISIPIGMIFIYTCSWDVYTYLQGQSVYLRVWFLSTYFWEIPVCEFFYTQEWIF